MPTQCLYGLVSQTGPGKQVCTLTGGTRQLASMKLGPDGSNWVVLSEAEVVALARDVNRYRHISKIEIDHLCAGKSGWAFRVFDSSLPHGVAFLHIRPPRKLDQTMGDGAVVNEFSGAELLAGYRSADAGSRAPRVWRRNVEGWDEIAVNFCLKNS